MNKEAKDLKQVILDSNEVKRIKELENYIDNNECLKKEFSLLKDIQRQMVIAKAKSNLVSYQKYKEEYEKQMLKVKEFPFVEEYFDLLEQIDLLLVNITKTIEEEINKKLN